MEFSRQEYWSGLPFPSPGDLPDPGMEPLSPALQAEALPSEPPGKPINTKGVGGIKRVILLLRIVFIDWILLFQSSPMSLPHSPPDVFIRFAHCSLFSREFCLLSSPVNWEGKKILVTLEQR